MLTIGIFSFAIKINNDILVSVIHISWYDSMTSENRS